MAEIRVWAPRAAGVELESDSRLLDMIRGHGGWWSVQAPHVRHGVDYAFRIDGRGPFPDPRSPWQPNGVHGPSRWVDHARFAWTDVGWQQPPLESAVIYELHVGTFTSEGTFKALIKRLDHLLDLGVTHVELMPVAEFSGDRGWGYDGVDLYAPHHAYGGPEGLKRLVDACHRKGLAVLLDVVYNHLGPSGNYLHQFGPYFTNTYVTPWGEAINMDGPDCDQVRRFFIDNALMWLRDYHLDGLRIDAVHAIVDTSAVHFLEQLAGEVRALKAHCGRHFVLIAESDLNDPRIIRRPEVGGFGLDAQWNEDFHHGLHAALSGESHGYYADFGRLADLGKTMTQGFAYDGCYSAFRRRRHGRSARGLSGSSFVGCLQNHDQVGNRAMGDRTSHLLTPGQLKIGAALVLLSPFTPMLFQGEEWGATTPFLYFTDHQEPELGEAVKKGRQEEFAAFDWDPEAISDPQARDTFERSRLDWNEAGQETHRALFEWHQALIELRRSNPDLTDDRLEAVSVDCDESAGWLSMNRGRISVVCNVSSTERAIPCRTGEVLLASAEGVSVQDNAVVLPGHGVAVIWVEPGKETTFKAET